jgi:hypothetical protein
MIYFAMGTFLLVPFILWKKTWHISISEAFKKSRHSSFIVDELL